MIPADELLSEMADLKLHMQILTAAQLGAPQWFSLRAACSYKGVNYNSIRVQKEKQPRCGIPDKMDGKNKYWSRDSIIEWSLVMDSNDWINYWKKFAAEYQQLFR